MNFNNRRALVSAGAALAISMVAAGNANALVLTSQSGVTTSASSCYLGCGNAQYDHSNIIDGDYGASGNNGLNSWNSGYWGGWVQIDFGAAYLLDRIELYAGNGYLNPYTLSVSTNGSTWTTVASGAYHVEPSLSQPASLSYVGVNYGAVHDVLNSTLASGIAAQFLRYNVNAGSPHWGYMYELRVDGHSMVSSVPEPESYALMLAGFGLLTVARRKLAKPQA